MARAGAAAGWDEAAYLAEVRGAVVAEVGRWVAAVARAEAEEAGLAAEMRAARARAGAGALLGGDPRAERADRVEAHLSRELDRALAQLERLRGLRPRARAEGGLASPAGIVV